MPVDPNQGVVNTDPNAGGDDVSNALDTVNDVLQYGRQKHGLLPPAQGSQQAGGVLPTQSFADGGDVQGPEMPTPPPSGPDNGDMDQTDQSMPAQPTDPVVPAQTPQAGAGQINPQSAKAYLQGAGAMPVQQAQQMEQQTGKQDPDTAKLQAVHTAANVGGPDVAWALMQNYRKQYDLQRTNAAVKLGMGATPQAAQAATEAYTNVLDGTHTQFTPNHDGSVTATVTKAGTNQPISRVVLTREQFSHLLTGQGGNTAQPARGGMQ